MDVSDIISIAPQPHRGAWASGSEIRLRENPEEGTWTITSTYFDEERQEGTVTKSGTGKTVEEAIADLNTKVPYGVQLSVRRSDK